MRRDFIASIIAALTFTVIFGLAYPLIATGVSQLLFPNKSDGSQVKLDGKTVGSKLIGQSFTIRHPIPEGPARQVRQEADQDAGPEVLPAAPLGDHLQPRRHLLQQPRP